PVVREGCVAPLRSPVVLPLTWPFLTSPIVEASFANEAFSGETCRDRSRLSGSRTIASRTNVHPWSHEEPTRVYQQGRSDSNAQPAVLETAALPIELHP